MKQIDIHYFAAASGERKVIPVLYNVGERSDAGMQVIRCKVSLPPGQVPSWLHPHQFDLITHLREDMQVVDYSAGSELRTLDAEFFRYKVYSEILFREGKESAA